MEGMDTGQSGEVAVSVEVLSQPDWVAFAALIVALAALAMTVWQILRNEGMQPTDGSNVSRALVHEDDEHQYWFISIRLTGPGVIHEAQMLLINADFVAPHPSTRPRMDCESKPMTAMIRTKKDANPYVGLGWYKSSLIGHRPVANGFLRDLRMDKTADAYSSWKWGIPQLGSPKKLQSRGSWKKLNRGVFRSKGGFPESAGLAPIDLVEEYPPELIVYTKEWADLVATVEEVGLDDIPGFDPPGPLDSEQEGSWTESDCDEQESPPRPQEQ